MGSCHFNLQRIQAYRSEEPGRTGIDGGVCPVQYSDDRPPSAPLLPPFLFPPHPLSLSPLLSPLLSPRSSSFS